MIKEIINTPNSLEKLFNKNVFEFISTLESNIDEIHVKISNQKIKRKQIISILNSLAENTSTEKYVANSNIINLDQCSEIIKLINSNIKSLYSIEVDLNNICSTFTDSYIANFYKSDSDLLFDTIRANINDYSAELAQFNYKFEENNSKIDDFLRNNASLNNDNSSDTKSSISNVNTYTSTEEFNKNIFLEDSAHSDNPYLVVSENDKKVFLPYKACEINDYLKKYPNIYSSFEDVVKKEFILPLEYYTKSPVSTRFRETYALIRDREGKSILQALKYSFDLMFKDDLNPTIIAACKTQQQLDDYLTCLEHKNLDNFKHFKIQFHVTPLEAKV